MKSFFKKIALVLTLAMVIGLVPVNTASAAATPGLKYSSKILYVDGDASGKYDDWCWTPSENTKGYDVSYNVKSGSNLIEVAKNGKITATGNGVGKAVVEVTYTSQNSGSSKTANFTVYVKKNASKVKLTNAVQKSLSQALSIGDEITLKTAKTASDYKKGNYGLDNYTKVITDKMRVLSSDESVVKVEGFKLTAVAAGTATLTVQSYQTEGNLVTAEQEYQIVIEENFSAQQSAHNQFLLTFKDHETANNAVEATRPSLNVADAPVTEAKDIIKVYKVLKNTENQEVSVFIGGLVTDPTSNIVTVTMFEELEEETEYVIRYQDKETRIKTPKYVADALEISVQATEKLTENSSKSTLGYNIYTTGTQGQKVNISGCKKYRGWQEGVTIEDLNTAEYHAEYIFDPSTNSSPVIWFYTAQANYGVRLKAVFEDWINTVDGKANVLSTTKTITPGDTSLKIGVLLDWGVVVAEHPSYNNNDSYKVKKFAVGDKQYGLAVKIQVTEYGVTSTEASLCPEHADRFTFVSSNDDKLAIDKETGVLYPPKDPIDGIVPVYVYYDDQYVGVCPVQVYSQRVLTSFSASLNTTKLSYNPIKAVDDQVILSLISKDQLEADFTQYVTFKTKLYNHDVMGNYIELISGSESSDTSLDNSVSGQIITIKAKPDLPKSITTIRLLCTATYTPDGKKEKVLNYSVTLTAKNTEGSEPRTYKVTCIDNDDVKNATDIDLKWGRTQQVSISAYSYDKDEFKVEHLDLSIDQNAKAEPEYLDPDQAYLSLRKNSDFMNKYLQKIGRDLVFNTVSVKNGVKIASGSSLVTKNNVINKVDIGTYVANLFIADSSNDNKAVFRASTPIVVQDSQPSVSWVWSKASTSVSVHSATNGALEKENIDQAINAAIDCITFKHLGSDIQRKVYMGYDKKDNNGNPTGQFAFSDDCELKGNKLTIKQIRYLAIYTDKDTNIEYYYEFVIPIMRTVTIGVTQ